MSSGFRIEFQSYSDPQTVASARFQGLLPFRLIAMPNEEDPTLRFSYGVSTTEVDPGYELLEKELGKSLENAAVRWSIAQLEERLRHGRLPPAPKKFQQIQKLVLTSADFELLKRMAFQKNCEYQMSSGRELFCSAAGPEDKAVIGTSGFKRLAPTSRPICQKCGLPDSDFLCSHLSHASVLAIASLGEDARQVMRAYCEIGRKEIAHPEKCHAGGHPCWARTVEPQKEGPTAIGFSPRELPIAIDFLGVVWKQALGMTLIHLKSVEKTSAIALPCATAEEFGARLGDLHELFKLMDIPQELLPTDLQEKLDKTQTFNRMEACLSKIVTDGADLERSIDAIDTLRAMSTARNKLTHGGSELAAALDQLGVEYPIPDHARAWDQVRSKIAEALNAIRSALQAAAT